MSERQSDLCSNCEAELADEIPGTSREPCPHCGSTARTRRMTVIESLTLRHSTDARIVRAWDSNSLTLAGVVFGIVVTVVGVVVATFGSFAAVIYAVVILVLLAAGLLLFGQRIIAAMRWLLERGRR
jgi:DNA-directed RNA polymerase subunit RPC12/RpoP